MNRFMTGMVSALFPQAAPDTDEQELRLTPWGDAFVNPVGGIRHALAGEGSYCVTTTPTPGTAVAYGSGGTQASFSDTVGFIVIKNNSQPSVPNPINVYLDYLRMLISGTVPASATSTQYAIAIDTGSRLPTANFTLLTPANTNFRSSRGSVAQVWVPNAGTITIPANTNRRLVGRGSLRQAISVTLDEYELRFGADSAGPAVSGQSVGRSVSTCAPVILGPQEWCVIHLWQPSGATNALSCELDMGHWER